MIGAGVTTATRRNVYRRDGYRCALCDSTKYIQIHHCVKRSEGGTNHAQNLITLCADCHALAHGTILNETDVTPEDVQQAIVEYLADFYAPIWNPWGGKIPYGINAKEKEMELLERLGRREV